VDAKLLSITQQKHLLQPYVSLGQILS
jgi:hypothetical protein